MVPREPTKAMRDAAMEVLMDERNIYTRDDPLETIVVETYTTKRIWEVMLAASPSVQDQPASSASPDQGQDKEEA